MKTVRRESVYFSRRWVSGGAELSEDGLHRFRLWRHWGPEPQGPHGVFVMLNPSWADERWDDATMTRVIGYAKREGWRGVEVVNLFSYRSADPRALIEYYGNANLGAVEADKHNEETVLDVCAAYGEIVVAWGAVADRWLPRTAALRALLHRLGKPLRCLGLTKIGQPLHPLRLAKNRPLQAFEAAR